MKLNINHFLNLRTFKKLALIFLLAAAAFPFQNCNKTPDDDPPKDTIPTPVIEPINTFKFNGITTYNLKWDSINMFGWYRKGNDLTTIIVEGYSNTKRATFWLKFLGTKVGTYKFSIDPSTNIEVTTGTGTTEKKYEFSTQPNMDMIINVTKYDPVGGRIKGTFSGNLQSSGSLETATITAGAFEVVRVQDEQ